MTQLNIVSVTTEELQDAISQSLKSQLQNFKKDLLSQNANDDLLTRKQTCEFLSINSSTLWHWTNKKKVIALGIGNRRYYKRSELLKCLTPLKK